MAQFRHKECPRGQNETADTSGRGENKTTNSLLLRELHKMPKSVTGSWQQGQICLTLQRIWEILLEKRWEWIPKMTQLITV